MELVTDHVVISADYCAREDNHTGIQRVTRALVQRWRVDHGAVASRTSMSDGVSESGARRGGPVYRHGQPLDIDRAEELAYRQRLVVPYRTTVVFPEVVHSDSSPTDLCLAAYSGNTTSAIGYDTIPILSSSLRPHGEAASSPVT